MVTDWYHCILILNKQGPAVYVNYGRKKDFDELAAAGVNLTGTIAVARYVPLASISNIVSTCSLMSIFAVLSRYGGVFRGLKVKAAQEAGCIGTLIYTDARDHGSVTEEAGYKPYPDGPAVHPNSVQRGSVQYLSSYPGASLATVYCYAGSNNIRYSTFGFCPL